jgi:uncharacterized protein (TIGR02231 family)
MRILLSRLSLIGLGLGLVVFASAPPARAADIAAASRIDAVTVFPDAAIVSRTAELALPEGESRIVFEGLPLGLDPDSVRVEAVGAGDVTIGAVDVTVTPAGKSAAENPIDAKLAALKRERGALQPTIDALQAERAMIIRFSQAGPDRLGADAKPLDMANWSAAWDAVKAGVAKVGEELQPSLAHARDLDAEIAALESERERPAADPATRQVAVAFQASTAGAASIALSYRIADVGWTPAYEASLRTQGQDVGLEFARRAIVAQTTGEDWNDVALTVSTARVARSAAVADVQSLDVDFFAPPPVAMPEAADAVVGGQLRRSTESAPAGAATIQPAAKTAMIRTAALETNGYDSEFKVTGRVSLPSDGSRRTFALSRTTATPALAIKTAPGFDETAYIEASFVNSEDAPVLSGDVALIRDGQFIGTQRIGFVAPGDNARLGFGGDDKIKVHRAPANRRDNDPTWFNQSRIETREFHTSVKNLHAYPVKVQVIDQAPMSENTAISVDLLPITTAPTEKQLGDRRGVMSWTLDLAAGETKEVRLAYRLKWPADRDIAIGGARLDEDR